MYSNPYYCFIFFLLHHICSFKPYILLQIQFIPYVVFIMYIILFSYEISIKSISVMETLLPKVWIDFIWEFLAKLYLMGLILFIEIFYIERYFLFSKYLLVHINFHNSLKTYQILRQSINLYFMIIFFIILWLQKFQWEKGHLMLQYSFLVYNLHSIQKFYKFLYNNSVILIQDLKLFDFHHWWKLWKYLHLSFLVLRLLFV